MGDDLRQVTPCAVIRTRTPPTMCTVQKKSAKTKCSKMVYLVYIYRLTVKILVSLFYRGHIWLAGPTATAMS